MINKVKSFIKKLKAVDILNILDEVLYIHREEILDMNRIQMLEGEDSTGGPLTDSHGYHGPTWDLFETGDFQSKMFIVDQGELFEIDSKDWKSDMLVERLGEDIFGLNKTNTEALRHLITSTFNNKLKKQLGL